MRISISKILCPVDFSESSDHALLYAVAFASTHGAQLTVLHVIEPPVCYPAGDGLFQPVAVEGLEAASVEELERLVAELKQNYDNVVWEQVQGHAFPEIVQVARRDDVDLIVMGTHGRTGLAHVLMGSVAEKVVRSSPCPVLTIKHPEHEFVMP